MTGTTSRRNRRAAPVRRARLRATILGAAAVALAAAAVRASPARAESAGGVPAAPLPVVATGARQDSITPAMIAMGEGIFRGKSGGALCMACHGLNAKGAPGLGPDLTDDKWLHGDGSFQFIQTIVRSGVPKPKESGAVMPPFGGAPLTDEQVRAVAAYVYSLSHR